MGATRTESKADWLCKRCVGSKEKWRKKGSDMVCTVCRQQKGLCFGEKVQECGSPTASTQSKISKNNLGDVWLFVEPLIWQMRFNNRFKALGNYSAPIRINKIPILLLENPKTLMSMFWVF